MPLEKTIDIGTGGEVDSQSMVRQLAYRGSAALLAR